MGKNDMRKGHRGIRRVCAILLSALLMAMAPLSVFAAEPQAPVEVSGARKAVRTSTDVALVALPLATVAGVLIARDWPGLKQGAFTAAATVGVTMLLKYTVMENRPDFSNRHSFPSGHASVTFATAAFLQRRYGWKFGGPAYAIAAYTAWGRVYGRKHHWWDVVAGAAIGAGSAYIFTRQWARDHELRIAPVTDGRTVGLTASFVI